MNFKLGHVVLGAGLVAVGGFAIWWWWKRRSAPAVVVPPGQIQRHAPPPPTQTTPVQVSIPETGDMQEVSQEVESYQDSYTIQSQTDTDNAVPDASADSTNVSDEIPSVMPPEETEDEPFKVAVKEVGPSVDTYTDMNQLVLYLETEENRKYGHPTKLDSWVKTHIEGLEQASEIRSVLEGKEG